MKRLLSGIFLVAAWLYAAQALVPASAAASHDAAMKSAVQIHEGVNLVSDKDLKYRIVVKGSKVVSVNLVSGPKGMMAKPIHVETVKKAAPKSAAHGLCAGYYYYYCWYDYYGNYWCQYRWWCY